MHVCASLRTRSRTWECIAVLKIVHLFQTLPVFLLHVMQKKRAKIDLAVAADTLQQLCGVRAEVRLQAAAGTVTRESKPASEIGTSCIDQAVLQTISFSATLHTAVLSLHFIVVVFFKVIPGRKHPTAGLLSQVCVGLDNYGCPCFNPVSHIKHCQ